MMDRRRSIIIPPGSNRARWRRRPIYRPRTPRRGRSRVLGKAVDRRRRSHGQVRPRRRLLP